MHERARRARLCAAPRAASGMRRSCARRWRMRAAFAGAPRFKQLTEPGVEPGLSPPRRDASAARRCGGLLRSEPSAPQHPERNPRLFFSSKNCGIESSRKCFFPRGNASARGRRACLIEARRAGGHVKFGSEVRALRARERLEARAQSEEGVAVEFRADGRRALNCNSPLHRTWRESPIRFDANASRTKNKRRWSAARFRLVARARLCVSGWCHMHAQAVSVGVRMPARAHANSFRARGRGEICCLATCLQARANGSGAAATLDILRRRHARARPRHI